MGSARLDRRAPADAAQDTGIGLTLLPVLHERAGFLEPGLREEQRRFATTVHDVLQLQRRAALARVSATPRSPKA